MARAAVLSLLRSDTTLADLGGAGFVVIPQHDADQKPDAEAFMVICWRHTDFDDDIQNNAGRHFDLYVHVPVAASPTGMQGSTDYGRIDAMIDRVDEILGAVEDGPPIVGGDGYQLEYVGFEGRSFDFTDDGYQTICKYASYMALCSKVIA